MTASYTIRPIEPRDDAAVAALIRQVMPEFGAQGAGFAITDPEVDAMCSAYSIPRAAYWVVEVDGTLCGGGGLAPLEGGDHDTCELRKMYFQPHIRGMGAGRALITLCLDEARRHGFRRCYLETLTNMHEAQRLYRAAGFSPIDSRLGATGHFGCNAFFIRDLQDGTSASD
jgi:putative acetyltransferase